MKKIFLLPFLVFSALCSSAQTTILTESFNTTSRTVTPPTGWTVTGYGSNDVGCGSTSNVIEQVPSPGFNCNGSTPNPGTHSGSGMAGYNSWDINNGGYSELVTPALDFSGPGTTTLNVWVWDSVALYGGSPNVQYDSLAIYVNTSPFSAGGTQLYRGTPSLNYSGTGWTLFTFNIPTSYSGTTNYIIFRAASRYGNDIFFDDVTVVRNPPAACSATPAAPVITTAAMSPSSPLCAGSSKTITATDPNYPTISGFTYQLETSPSLTTPSWTAVATSPSTTTGLITFSTGAISASAYFRINTICTASTNSSASAPYYVIVGAPQPSTITGSPSFCPGDVSTYSVTNVTGTTYAWTLPSGWSGSSTSNSISVTPGTTAGSISVTATSSCGTSIPRTLAVAAGSAPTAPATITGNNAPCLNTSQTYSITAVTGATSYTWAVPSGWTVTNTGTGGLSVTATTSLNSGNVTVTATNGCGSNSKNLPVTVVTSLPGPGTITPSSTTICSGALYTFSVNPVAGATSYIWSLPTGWSGTVTGATAQVFPDTSNGVISVTAYSPCATSPTSSLSVTVTRSVVPTISVSQSSTLICQTAPITFTANITNGGTSPSYLWQKNGVPQISTGPTYLDNKLSTGDVIKATLVSNAVCRTSDSTVSDPLTLTVTPMAIPGISINSTPMVTVCAGTPVSFTTTITGGGTLPTYQWYRNGNPIGGANAPSYTTSSLANNDTVTVQLTTSAVCYNAQNVLSNKVGMVVNDVVSPTITITATSTQPVSGMEITFTATQSGGGPTPVYQWILNNVEIPNATGDTYKSSTLQNGDRVSVRMISYDPCAKPGLVTSNEVIMGNQVGVVTVSNWDGAISLYPNPTGGRFTIATEWNGKHTGKQVDIDLYNMVGQNIYHSSTTPDKAAWKYNVQLSEGISAGHYMLRLSSSDGMRASMPVILNR